MGEESEGKGRILRVIWILTYDSFKGNALNRGHEIKRMKRHIRLQGEEERLRRSHQNQIVLYELANSVGETLKED